MGVRSADAQLLFLFHAEPAATEIAAARSCRCWPVSDDTSADVKMAARPASRAIAAKATARKVIASRSPSVSARAPRSVIAGQAQPVTAAEDGLDNARIGRIVLDLAPQVLHMRVDGSLVALELISPHPVDQLEPGVHPAGDRRERHEDAP